MLVTLLAALVASRAGAEPPRPLRAVSFNMLHGGPWSGLRGDRTAIEERLALATAELRALSPDVIGLQEASVGRGLGNLTARLAAALGTHHVHASATSRVMPIPFVNWLIVNAINFAEGPAVLSRYPITGWQVYDLPRCEKWLYARVLLRAEVATPWGPLAVFSTHLSRDDCQVARVAEIVRERSAKGPVILMGDFNAVETASAILRLREDGFVDAFRAANPGATGATVWQRPDASDRTASRRVDYIFVAGVPRDARLVCASRVVLDTPSRDAQGRTLWPSDHYGVLADLDVFGIKCAP